MFLTSVWLKFKGFLGKGISQSDWSDLKSGLFLWLTAPQPAVTYASSGASAKWAHSQC